MTTFKYDPNNTEGSYPTAMVVENAELKKGDKIVATDIVDLYDTNINSPVDDQALVYSNDEWINGNIVVGGDECNLFPGYTSDGYTNSVFIDANTSSIERIGSYLDPFISLEEVFIWLRNSCAVISDDIPITIEILSDLTITEITSLNHPYGYNIIINGNDHKIINTNDIYITGYMSSDPVEYIISNIDGDDAIINISCNNSITIKDIISDFDLNFTTHQYNIIDDIIYINGNPITDYTYEIHNVNINLIGVNNNSDINIDNFQSINNDPDIMIKEITPDVHYIVIYLNKIPISLTMSKAAFHNVIPDNIDGDMNSTLELSYLQYDINNWKIKNNSYVIINTDIDPIIDIYNENSTIIKNDAII